MTYPPTQNSVVSDAQPMKYGERAIAEGQLITFPNPRIGRRYHIDITLPEFTCKCPFSDRTLLSQMHNR